MYIVTKIKPYEDLADVLNSPGRELVQVMPGTNGMGWIVIQQADTEPVAKPGLSCLKNIPAEKISVEIPKTGRGRKRA